MFEYLGILVDSTNPLVQHSPLRLKKCGRPLITGSTERR